MDVFLDGVDIFHIFFDRIGVIVTQVSQPAVFLRDAKVNANGFGVADMKVTVGFWRKAGVHPAAKPAGAIVFVDYFLDKVGFSGCLFVHRTLLVNECVIIPSGRGLRPAKDHVALSPCLQAAWHQPAA